MTYLLDIDTTHDRAQTVRVFDDNRLVLTAATRSVESAAQALLALGYPNALAIVRYGDIVGIANRTLRQLASGRVPKTGYLTCD